MSLANLASFVRSSEDKKEPSFEDQFIKVIEDYLVDSRYQAELERDTIPAFRPSSYYKCKRQVWFSLHGTAAQKQYPRSIRILEVGTALHEWIQEDVFMKLGINNPVTLLGVEDLPVHNQEGIEFIKEHSAPPMEVKFRDYRFTRVVPISGMIDGFFNFLNKDCLFEFKTINPDDFKYLLQPLEDHKKQGALYSMCLGIRYILFLYLCKGTQNWKPYLVEYSEEDYKQVKETISEIENYFLRKLPPPKEDSKECRWCLFKNTCQKVGDYKGTLK